MKRKQRRAGQATTASGLVKPGGIGHIFVEHDDWCDLLKGRGGCNYFATPG